MANRLGLLSRSHKLTKLAHLKSQERLLVDLEDLPQGYASQRLIFDEDVHKVVVILVMLVAHQACNDRGAR